MKKLFTLMTFVLMAGSAFGQKNWTNVIVNGDLEGTAPAYETLDAVSADAWNSFWVHEWPGDQSVRYDGTANVVEDPADPSNHCVKVVIRSRAEGEAAGNLTKDYTGNDGTYGSWDCQFFIYATQPIPQGKEIRLQLKVKADREGSFETQNHSVPGTYIDANAFGNPKYTTEWTTLKLDPITVTESQETSGYQSIAFNLCTDEDANVIYFDDIKLQIRDPQEGGDDAGAWINFMRKGIYSDDHITGTSPNEGDWECSNFTIQTPEQTKAPVVEVPGEPGVMAVHVPVKGYVIREIEDLDEEGNQQFDDDGNVKMKNVYYWNNGDSIGTSAPARWTCQFFVSTLHKMVKGEKFRFKFRCKADKPTNLGTQAHYGPGKYKDYNTFGDESAFPIDADWKTFELGDFESVEDASKHVIPSGANGCQTITFDCVPLEGEDNNFYLIVDEFSFTEKYVTIGDRTLGTPETIGLAVNLDDDEKANTIDMSNMLNTFEEADFSFLKNGKDGIKLYTLLEPDDPEDDPIESFSGLLNWTDGGFVGKDGLYIDDENGISIRLDDSSIDGAKINVMVWNNPDAGISFANGETVNTKLAISQSGWYYVYNVILSADGTGIRDIQMTKNDGKIYDLMGRRVNNPTKGIYIQNGKKFFVK
ncbi:MAG: hypothetical protein J6W43_06140 [Prevotella sp.]|nr:hypothetical protein [Prevotella sp.]